MSPHACRNRTNRTHSRFGLSMLLFMAFSPSYDRSVDAAMSPVSGTLLRPATTFQDPSTTATTTTATTAMTHLVSGIPRGGGGGWFGLRRSPDPAKLYQASLEEQLMVLDQQWRTTSAELNTLRDQRKTQRQNRRYLQTLSSQEHQEEEKELRQQQQQQQRIETLQQQLEQLETMKQELESLMEESTARIQELQDKLTKQEGLTKALESNFQEQIAALQAELEQVTQQQAAKLEQVVEDRISEAGQAARQEALMEVDGQIRQVTQELQSKHAKELKAERERSFQAVEAEKKKMRKLVKALAIREKKLFAQAERDRKKNVKHSNRKEERRSGEKKGIDMPTTPSIIPSSSSSGYQKPKTAPTTRGFI